MPSQASKRKLVDVREQRHSPRKIEMRDDPRTGDLLLEGYASTFDEYEVYGGPENYGWIEKIDRKAFNETLNQKPDLHLLINHDGMPLARTKSGTLTLSVDNVGLKVQARLDRTDPDVQALIPKMARGDMDEMSFAFRVKDQQWSAAEGFEDDPMSYRVITELSLQRGDVSVVNFGANPNTSAALATVGALGALADSDLSELRNQVDKKTLAAAAEVLAKLTGRAESDDDLMADVVSALSEAVDLIGEFKRSETDADVLKVFDLVSEAFDLIGRKDDDDDEDDDEDDEDDDDRSARASKGKRRTRRAQVDDDRLSEANDALGEAADLIQQFDRAAFDPDAIRVFDLTSHAQTIVNEMYGMGDPDDGSEALGARKRSPYANARGRASQRGARRTPVARRSGRIKDWTGKTVATAKRAGTKIADGLRIEVGGTKTAPVVRLHDASGLLDEALCNRLTSEVREALLGNRGQVSSAKPTSESGDRLSTKAAAQLTGGDTEKLAAAKVAVGQDPRATVSIKEAHAAVG